jgi:hypothetical protein
LSADLWLDAMGECWARFHPGRFRRRSQLALSSSSKSRYAWRWRFMDLRRHRVRVDRFSLHPRRGRRDKGSRQPGNLLHAG